MDVRVTARRHRLRLDRRRIIGRARADLERNDAAQIIVDAHHVHDHHAAVGSEERRIAAIRFAGDIQQTAAERARIEWSFGPRRRYAVASHPTQHAPVTFDAPRRRVVGAAHEAARAIGEHDAGRAPNTRRRGIHAEHHADRRITNVANAEVACRLFRVRCRCARWRGWRRRPTARRRCGRSTHVDRNRRHDRRRRRRGGARRRDEQREQPPTHHASAIASSSRFSVSSTSASECADDMNAASNADGARYTPRSSAAWKKRLNRSTSDVFASEKFRTGSARKKKPHIDPALSAVNGTPRRAALSRSPWTSRVVRAEIASCTSGVSPRSVASPPAIASGLPDNVPAWYTGPFGAICSIKSARPPYAATGKPPPITFPSVV